MRIVTLEQRSPEWLAWRSGGLGGSDAPAVMGASRWHTPQELWELKTGRRAPPPMNPYMQRGVDYEDEAREYFEAQLGDVFSPLCAEHDELSYIRASYDGVDMGISYGLEIKVPGVKAHRMATEGIVPPYYVHQLQHQILVGLDMMFYGSYVPELKSGVLIPVPRDNQIIDELLEAEAEFWRHVQEDEPMYTPEWAEKAAMWLLADVDAKAAKLLKEQYAEEIKKLIPEGFKSFKAAGVNAFHWEKSGDLDTEQILREFGLSKEEADVRFRGQKKPMFTVKAMGSGRKSEATA